MANRSVSSEPGATNLVITSSPFTLEQMTTPKLMRLVIYATLPIIAMAVFVFGPGALLIIGASVTGCAAAEWVVTRGRAGTSSLRDGSGLLTGILLGLTLPPNIPLWLAALGGVVGMVLGKMIWGGIGANVFNPALVGRAFLQTSFPTIMTTWSEPVSKLTHIDQRLFTAPFMQANIDGVSAATPLGQVKFDHVITPLSQLFWGNTAGSLGETCALLIILCGLVLGIKRVFDWRLPIATLSAAAITALILYGLFPERSPANPIFALLSGGLLFGAVFMVTDPVTSPLTKRGMWCFGAGVGFLTVLIRVFGGFPEGVMFSILLMNAVTPLINRLTQPRPFGGRP